MSDLHISWPEYHRKIETLAISIDRSGWDFETIVAIAKGGLRVGDLLCRLFCKPLAILSAASYGGKDNRIRGKITISKHLAMTRDRLGERVLLIDDLVDSGVSLREATNWLMTRYCDEIREIRTGVIWYKGRSQIKPDYYVDYLADNPWIYQPFEKYERITPRDLFDSRRQMVDGRRQKDYP